MGPLRLVPLLASLQILLPRASPTDPPPPPPTITVTPEKHEYLMGDAIAIQCTAPAGQKIQGFQFSGTSGWAVDVRTTRRSYIYRFNVTGPKDGGLHACTYVMVDRFRQPVRSKESRAVIINVRDRPAPPTLTLTPSNGVALEGQALVFLCAAPAGAGERRFRFYQGKREVISGAQVTLGEAEARLRVAAGGRSHSGNFTCGYEEKTEGRWIPSYPSGAVGIHIKEAASAPRLGLDPPGGVVSEGYPLRITCAAARDEFALRFRFYRDGVEIAPGQGGSKSRNVGNSSELFFPQSPRGFGGNFSCGVEEEVGGAWVPSRRSDALEVSVKDLPAPPALLLDPPSGQVLEGDPVVLTCAANASAAPRKFAFYKDGTEQFTETGAQARSRFRIPAASAPLAAGRFTCRYEEKLSDWWIPSPLSQAVAVTTQARPQLIPLVAGCSAGVAALVLVLLLVVCLCRRRRGGVHWKGLHNKDDPSAYPMANVYNNDI